MTDLKNRCYLCDRDIPPKQSYYEDYGVRVCVKCLPGTPRCVICRFPSLMMKEVAGKGKICEFCADKEITELTPCYLCNKSIPEDAPHYADYGKKVCKPCFKDAPRCFMCRFPNAVETVRGLGNVCEFCSSENLSSKSDLSKMLKPLTAFIGQLGHNTPDKPKMMWVDWKVLLGMQIQESRTQFPVEFLDEMINYCYPVYHLKARLYLTPRLHPQWFMPYVAGQLVAADLCERYQIAHLLEAETPFHRLARGWSHWVTWQTARTLKYEKIAKQLKRKPINHLRGDFEKLLSMSDFRKSDEIRSYVEQNLAQLAKKCL